MAFENPFTLKKVIREMIQEEVKKVAKRGIQIFKVTEVNKEEYTVNIRHLHFKKLSFNNVQMAGTGLGNAKGVMTLPNVEDFVIVSFYDEGTTPIILGTVFDKFSQNPDNIPGIELNEIFITNKENGAIIYINKDSEIIISKDTDGSSKVVVKKDGTIKILGSTVTVDGSSILMNGGSKAVARVGDTISVTIPGGSSAGTYSGTITSGSPTISAD